MRDTVIATLIIMIVSYMMIYAVIRMIIKEIYDGKAKIAAIHMRVAETLKNGVIQDKKIN